MLLKIWTNIPIRNSDNSVLNKANAINNAKFKINGVQWSVSHYTTSVEQEKIMFQLILCRVSTKLQYVESYCYERSKYEKKLNWGLKKD